MDQHNRLFMNLWHSERTPTAILSIPVVGFDGTHSRHGKYNGDIISLIGGDENLQKVKLASALDHVETRTTLRGFIQWADAEIDL